MQTWRLLGLPALASHLALNLILITAILAVTGAISYALRWSEEKRNDAARAPDIPRKRTALVGARSAPRKLELNEDDDDWDQNDEENEWLEVVEEEEEVD